MPKPDWYNTVIKGRSKTALRPRGREGTVTPKMQHGWLTHGAIHRTPRMHKIRRKRYGGMHKLRTVFEEPSLVVFDDVPVRIQLRTDDLAIPLDELGEARRVWTGWGPGKKKSTTPPSPKKGIKKRKSSAVKPKGKKGGIPPQHPGGLGGPPTIPPEVDTTVPLSRPRQPEYPPEVKAKIRSGELSRSLAKHPANWQTTQVGPAVKPPKKVAAPARKKPEISTSAMYKHVVRAIYHRGNKIKYKWQHTAAKSAQEIAREKMKKWGYGRDRSQKGGSQDSSRLSLTAKGQQRSRKHAREPAAVLHSKSADFRNIVDRDPL